MIALDFQSRVPIYEQLVNGIIRLRILGVLTPDEQLPAVRSLAVTLAINPNTVQKAYQLLEEQQIIYSLPGKGSFIKPLENQKLLEMKETSERLKKAAVNAFEKGLPLGESLQIIHEAYERGMKYD
ncbi:MAG: hypothetical protein BGN88_11725 [Clostridiales bacterium 43-6]|nr:MAG: hypothetical protein BGN88_11725 [Clostridiales bacterium 43-6]